MTLDKRVVNDMKITNNDMLNIFKRKSQILNSVRNPSINEVSYIFLLTFIICIELKNLEIQIIKF